jgi:hypothetical protein
VTGLRTKFSHNPNVGRKTEKRSLYTDKKCKFPHDPNVERKTKKRSLYTDNREESLYTDNRDKEGLAQGFQAK